MWQHFGRQWPVASKNMVWTKDQSKIGYDARCTFKIKAWASAMRPNQCVGGCHCLLLFKVARAFAANRVEIGHLDVIGLAGFFVVETTTMDWSAGWCVNCRLSAFNVTRVVRERADDVEKWQSCPSRSCRRGEGQAWGDVSINEDFEDYPGYVLCQTCRWLGFHDR